MSFEPLDPRLRVSRSATLALTTSFQKIDFTAGASDPLNVNTFGNSSDGTNMVTWDTTNKLFKINYPEDRNFTAFFGVRITTSLLTVRATFQYQLVIPNGVSPGVDFVFPFTDFGGMVDMFEVTILAIPMNKLDSIPLYANQVLRTNGFYIQCRLSNALITLGTSTLNYAFFLIQGQGK